MDRLRGITSDRVALKRKVAMLLLDEAGLEQFEYASEGEWKAVTYPVSGKDPGASHKLQVKQPVSIHNGSSQKDQAWELLKMLGGSTFSRYESGGSRLAYGIPVHRDYICIPLLDNMEVITSQMGKVDPIPPSGVYYEIIQTGNNYYGNYLSGQYALEEALEYFQYEIEKILQANE